jgi:ABC-type sugar transport system ATPase subunit
VGDGEAVAVLGPSGCGKTTLLRVVAGLEAPDSGTVRFDGDDVTDVGAQQRGVGMVFQSYALYPHMDSKRNLGFFFKMHHREPETEARVAAVCEIMGQDFRTLLSRKPSELSGGQRQRVAVGRCIIREPSVFLFDEPLSNLDAKLRATMRVEIKRLIRRFAVTSFYVTHDQLEAIAICDRIAVMREGRLEQFGTYRQIYDRPATAFVAGFVGSPAMNMLEGAAAGLVAGATGDATIGVRPEDLNLAGDGQPGFEARVFASEPLISERRQIATCLLPDGTRLVAKLPGTDPYPPDTVLRLTCEPDRLHRFDAAGRRLE